MNNSVREFDAELESNAHKTTQGPSTSMAPHDDRFNSDPKDRVLNQRVSD